MRRHIVGVAAVIVCCGTVETPGKWTHPGARTDARLAAV